MIQKSTVKTGLYFSEKIYCSIDIPTVPILTIPYWPGEDTAKHLAPHLKSNLVCLPLKSRLLPVVALKSIALRKFRGIFQYFHAYTQVSLTSYEASIARVVKDLSTCGRVRRTTPNGTGADPDVFWGPVPIPGMSDLVTFWHICPPTYSLFNSEVY